MTIGEKNYNNFLSLLSDVDDFAVLKVQKLTDGDIAEFDRLSKEKLETSLTASLHNCIKAMKDVRATKDERELLKQRHRYSSKKIPVRQVNQRVDEIGVILEERLDKRIEDVED